MLSAAERPTVTGWVLYHPVEKVVPLQVIEGVPGAVLSTCTSWDFTASALPATSVEKNRTVEVWEIVKGTV